MATAAAVDNGGHGGAGKPRAPPIYSESTIQLRLWLWFGDNETLLTVGTTETGESMFALPRSFPWSDGVLADKPALRELNEFMRVYGINIEQVKRQLQLWAASESLFSLAVSDDEARADILGRLGDIKILAKAAVQRSRTPDVSALCAPGARGSVHYMQTLVDVATEAEAFCEQYISELVSLTVAHRADKASRVTANVLAFTKDMVAYNDRQLGAARGERAVDDTTKHAVWLRDAAQKRLTHLAQRARTHAPPLERSVQGAATIAEGLVSTSGASIVDELIRSTYAVFSRGLTGNALTVVVIDEHPPPPGSSLESAELYYISGWLVYKVMRCVQKQFRGASISSAAKTSLALPTGETEARSAAITTWDTKSADQVALFEKFAREFCDRAVYTPDETMHAARVHKLNLTKAQAQKGITGYDPMYATARMHRFTALLDGVCRSAFDDDTKLCYLGPSTLVSVQHALINSPVAKRMLLNVFREHPSNDMVTFGSVDRADLDSDAFFGVSDLSDDDVDRLLGDVQLSVPDSFVRELLTILVSAFVSMKGKDMTVGHLRNRSGQQVAASAVAFRGTLDSAGRALKRVAVAQSPEVVDGDFDIALPVSVLDRSLDMVPVSGARDAPPVHVTGCDCGGKIGNEKYCKFQLEWSCSHCYTHGQTYYAAAACCLATRSDEKEPQLTVSTATQPNN